MRKRLSGNAHAVICNVENRITALSFNRHLYPPAGRRVLDGIIQQIHDHLFQAARIALHAHR